MDIPIRYKRNKRAKYLRIKILKNQTVEVVVPPFTRLQEAEKFVQDNLKFIKQKIAEQPNIVFNKGLYQTKYHRISISKNRYEKSETELNGSYIDIKTNPALGIEHSQNQEYIQYVFTETLRFEAKKYIPKRVLELSKKHGLSFQNIKINSAKTRWGSCSSSDNLNFSCFLMMLPYHLIDYVILHELSHTIHKNHSRDFYTLLNRLSEGNHDAFNQELKQYTVTLYPKYFQLSK